MLISFFLAHYSFSPVPQPVHNSASTVHNYNGFPISINPIVIIPYRDAYVILDPFKWIKSTSLQTFASSVFNSELLLSSPNLKTKFPVWLRKLHLTFQCWPSLLSETFSRITISYIIQCSQAFDISTLNIFFHLTIMLRNLNFVNQLKCYLSQLISSMNYKVNTNKCWYTHISRAYCCLFFNFNLELLV